MTENPEFGRLWKTEEVALYLGVEKKAVYKARDESGLPAIKINGSWRYKPSSVRSWVDGQERGTISREASAVPPVRSVRPPQQLQLLP